MLCYVSVVVTLKLQSCYGTGSPRDPARAYNISLIGPQESKPWTAARSVHPFLHG